MSKEKQTYNPCDDCPHSYSKNNQESRMCKICEFTYFRDHKQSEGEWITSDIPQEKYVCSVCGGACWYYDCQGDVAKSRYCPNCGAKMKGGEE